MKRICCTLILFIIVFCSACSKNEELSTDTFKMEGEFVISGNFEEQYQIVLTDKDGVFHFGDDLITSDGVYHESSSNKEYPGTLTKLSNHSWLYSVSADNDLHAFLFVSRTNTTYKAYEIDLSNKFLFTNDKMIPSGTEENADLKYVFSDDSFYIYEGNNYSGGPVTFYSEDVFTAIMGEEPIVIDESIGWDVGRFFAIAIRTSALNAK